MKIIPRKFNFEDIETRVSWINNPSIYLTMYFDVPISIESTLEWYKRIKVDNFRIDFSFISETGELLAMGGFTGIDYKNKNAEFYIMVNPDLQGKGIGKSVSLWMCNYGFSILHLNKIYLYTDDNNIFAYKIYEKAGFTLEGVMRKHKYKNGTFQDRRFYGLLHSEWEKLLWKEMVTDVS